MIINSYIHAPAWLPKTQALVTAADLTNFTYINAINTFEQTLTANGLLAKAERMRLFVCDKSTNAERAVQMSKDFINPTTKNLTFSGGIIHATTGTTGNGINNRSRGAAIDYGVVGVNDMMVCFYSRTDQIRYLTELYAQQGGVSSIQFWTRYDASNSFGAMNDGGFGLGASLTNTLGLMCLNRSSATTVKMYQNGVLKSTLTRVSSGLPTTTDYEEMGGLGYFSNKEWCFSAVMKSLTDAEHTIFYNAVQTLQTSLSRQV